MAKVTPRRAPKGSLIAPFAAKQAHHTDAYSADLPHAVTLGQFLQAVYSTPLFKAERTVLRLAGHGGSDAEIAALAADRSDRFAAWAVEGRRADEILLADLSGRTRSWLKAEAQVGGTRLWFGSVVTPVERDSTPRLGRAVASLIRAHRLYSRALLSMAARRLRR